MFSSDYTRWLTNAIFAAPTAWGAVATERASSALLKVAGVQTVQNEIIASLMYPGCAALTLGAVCIILNEWRCYMEWEQQRAPVTNNRPTVADKRESEPAPSPFENLNLVTRVNGVAKPAAQYNYVTQAVRLNKERRVAMILLRNNDRGEAFDLTEETWARNKTAANGQKIKKFMSRSELNALKTKWELNGLICRLSPAKNATYDAYDWNKIKSVAQGHPLPR